MLHSFFFLQYASPDQRSVLTQALCLLCTFIQVHVWCGCRCSSVQIQCITVYVLWLPAALSWPKGSLICCPRQQTEPGTASGEAALQPCMKSDISRVPLGTGTEDLFNHCTGSESGLAVNWGPVWAAQCGSTLPSCGWRGAVKNTLRFWGNYNHLYSFYLNKIRGMFCLFYIWR